MVFFLLQQTRMLRHPVLQIQLEGVFDPLQTCVLPQNHPTTLIWFSQSFGTTVNYSLWTLSSLLMEALNSLHIHLFKYPIPISYQCISPQIHSFVLDHVGLLIDITNHHLPIQPLHHFRKGNVSFFPLLIINLRSPVYRF